MTPGSSCRDSHTLQYAELDARDQRRAAAEGLLTAMDDGEFDLDLDAIDRLNRAADLAT